MGKRDPNYVLKFFGYEMGAQTSYTNKEGEGERAIINGHHQTEVFQNLLDKFISMYVLCANCGLPEIDMGVNKKGLIVATCEACGWNGDLDNVHEVATFIQKNPPDTGVGFDGEGKKEKKSREERQRDRQQKQRKSSKEDADEDDDKDEKEETEKKEKKEKKDKKEKKEKKRKRK